MNPKIGETFTRGTRTWLCTDRGSRTFTAVCLSPSSRLNNWFRNLPEDVFCRAQEEGRLDPAWLPLPVHRYLQEHVFELQDEAPGLRHTPREKSPMICKFCHQAIYETETSPGANGPVHMRGKFRHVEEDALYCHDIEIRPDAPKPTCHVCGVEEPPHKGGCSFSDKPRAMAQPR